MYSLGINLSHDRSACLMGPGGRVVAIAEERLDKLKHSCVPDSWGRWFVTVPVQSVNYCLNSFGIGFEDLDAVVFCNAVVVDGPTLRNLTVADCVWQLPWCPRAKVAVMNHHLAHAYSAFFPSGFEESAVLVIDKGGSVITHHRNGSVPPVPLLERASVYRATPSGLTLLKKVIDRATAFYVNCNSLGAIYELATTFIGYSAFDAGKTMGLAPYGTPRHAEHMKSFVQLTPDGYNAEWLIQSVVEALIPNFAESQFGPRGNSPSEPTQNDRDVARAAQEVVEEVVCHLANLATERAESKRLCFAGGIALNSVANTRVRRQCRLEDMYVQPASADDGTALGAAVYGWRDVLGLTLERPPATTALGRHYSAQEVYGTIYAHPRHGVDFVAQRDVALGRVASLVAEGRIVGWFDGGSEFGPRALGHRSILADPRRRDMKDLLNARVKHREGFRPYAASVLLERAPDWFEINFDSPYMLFVVNVRPEARSSIPAVTHVDGTCRVQTVRRDREANYYDLIAAFHEATGVPLILNTSFNVNRQPIVESPLDALDCFLNTRIDHLYLQGYLLSKLQPAKAVFT